MCRRSASQIHKNVIHRTRRASNDLRFGMRFTLIVHPPQRSFARVERNTALRHPGGEASVFKLLRAPTARKESALVETWFKFDDVRAAKRSGYELHSITSTVGMGTTKRLPAPRTSASCSRISYRKFQGSNSTVSGLVRRY